MLNEAENLSYWIQYEILYTSNIARKNNILNHFLSVIDQLLKLNNYFCVFAFMQGLTNPPIRQLWKNLHPKLQKVISIFYDAEKITDASRSYKYYRDQFHSLNPPMLPTLTVPIQDLDIINASSPNNINGNMININKFMRMRNVVKLIIMCQHTQYVLQEEQSIQDYIAKCLTVRGHHKKLSYEQMQLQQQRLFDYNNKITRQHQIDRILELRRL